MSVSSKQDSFSPKVRSASAKPNSPRGIHKISQIGLANGIDSEHPA
jgi:hypothetical protein